MRATIVKSHTYVKILPPGKNTTIGFGSTLLRGFSLSGGF